MEQKRLVNLVLWPVALLVLNSLWMSVAGGVAPYEINDVDQDIETRTVELESVLGFSKEMPAEMEVEFTGVSVDDGAVSWTIRDASGTVIAQWAGLLSEGPPNWSGALEPGTYTVETTVDEGIVAEQVLQIQPFESYRLEGHIILSISLFLVAFGEVFIRQKAEAFMTKRVSTDSSRVEKSPFKPLRTGMPDDDLSLDDDGPWRSPIGR